MPASPDDVLTNSISIETEAGLLHFSACSAASLDELLNMSMDKPVCATMVLCSIIKQPKLHTVNLLSAVCVLASQTGFSYLQGSCTYS